MRLCAGLEQVGVYLTLWWGSKVAKILLWEFSEWFFKVRVEHLFCNAVPKRKNIQRSKGGIRKVITYSVVNIRATLRKKPMISGTCAKMLR